MRSIKGLVFGVFFWLLVGQNALAQNTRIFWQAAEIPEVRLNENTLVADFDNDGTVGFADFLLFVRSYNAQAGEAAFDARMDLNNDGAINFSDFISFGAAYGAQAEVSTQAEYAVYVLDAQLGAAAVFDSKSHLIFDYLRFRGPTGIQVADDDQTIYISEGFGLFAIDAEHQALFSIPTESQGRIALSPDERFLYATEELRARVLVMDLDAREVVDTIAVGQGPVDMEITPDGKKLYVVNAGSRDISVIDLVQRENVGRIIIGAVPAEIAITKDGRRAYVTNIDRGVISVLDLNADRVIGGIQLSENTARGMAFSPDGGTLYVASGSGSTGGFLLAIDVQRNLISRRLKVGDATSALGISPDGARAYVGTLVLQGGGAGLTAVDLENWKVMGRVLGVDFIAQIAFRRLSSQLPIGTE